jgi:tellurite resistance protein TerC
VLIFIGSKIFYHGLIGAVPALLSLGVTVSLLTGGILLSLFKTRDQPHHPANSGSHK